uniref:C-type lectin domain-containing protein n=1 Tax=Anabas testudineus TaxID=64144 RepID=A0A3Q1IM03_ANATE
MWAAGKPRSLKIFSGTAGTQNTSNFIFVNQSMTWKEAQSYCRVHYTDLASVRNQAENDQMKMIITQNQNTWIGLYRNSWAWSDGSPYSFSNWGTSQTPSGTATDACLNSYYGQWIIRDCTSRNFFACYASKLNLDLHRL